MKNVKQFFNFYIHASMHVGFAAVAFAFLRMHELQLSIDIDLLVFIFLATITGYNFVKYAGLAKLYHRSLTNQLKSIQIFSMLVFVGMVYLAFQLRWETIFVLMVLLLINFLYAFPIFSDGRNLRSLSVIKVFLIAFVWSITTVILPSLEARVQLNSIQLFQCVQQFLMVMALMIPFEIRDMRFDSTSLQTLPQVFGVEKSKIIGVVFLLSCLLLAYGINDISFNFTLIFSILLLPLLAFAKPIQPRYYSSFFVEAIPILTILIYVLL